MAQVPEGRCVSAGCPVHQVMWETFEAIRQREVERHTHRFDQAGQADLDRLTRSIMRQVLAVPLARLDAPEHLDAPGRCAGLRAERLAWLFSRPDDGSNGTVCPAHQPSQVSSSASAMPRRSDSVKEAGPVDAESGTGI